MLTSNKYDSNKHNSEDTNVIELRTKLFFFIAPDQKFIIKPELDKSYV